MCSLHMSKNTPYNEQVILFIFQVKTQRFCICDNRHQGGFVDYFVASVAGDLILATAAAFDSRKQENNYRLKHSRYFNSIKEMAVGTSSILSKARA